MDMYELAKNILALSGNEGINKVRFAKTIYFVHKELIRNNLSTHKAFNYIRMPLGPVPERFMELESLGNEIKIKKISHPLLQFDAFSYTTKATYKGSEETKKVIQSTIKKLSDYSTSTLVETSHMDPSWLAHQNGDTYTITTNDLKNNLDILKIVDKSTNDERDRMRSALLKGMLKDIVEETTSLEYPS